MKAARNADGEVYNVPADMTYKQWQETFAEGGTKDDLNILNVFDDSDDTNLKNEDLNLQNSDLSATLEKVGDNVNYVGKLDKDIYKCIADDIVSDEVIITDKQIEHIKAGHPDDYELYSRYFSEIIAQPDYILEANKPNTAFVLKEIVSANEKFELILRLHTSLDEEGYKNSIITFLHVKTRKYQKYLRNKKILYKRE